MAQQLAAPSALPEDLGSILVPPPAPMVAYNPFTGGSGALGLSPRALTDMQAKIPTRLKKNSKKF